jgi:hypothetical protein
MSKVFSNGLIPVVRVKAVDVLPCIACFAIDRVSVVVREVADTLDGVRLFFYRLNLVGDIVLDGEGTRGRDGLTRNHDMR